MFQFVVSILSSMVVVPLSLLLVQMFRHIGPRPVTKEDRLKREELLYIEEAERGGEFEEFELQPDQDNQGQPGQVEGDADLEEENADAMAADDISLGDMSSRLANQSVLKAPILHLNLWIELMNWKIVANLKFAKF